MKNIRLQDWERQAIRDAYLAGEKVEAIAAEFGIIRTHVCEVAERLGARLRRPGRPPKENVERKNVGDRKIPV